MHHSSRLTPHLRAAATVLASVLAAGAAAPLPAAEPASQAQSAPSPSLASAPEARPAPPLPFDTSRIETLTGARGTAIPQEHVFKVIVPRDDVAVKVDGLPIPPGMGVTSWAGFTPMESGGLMVMGDLALFEDEVNPVLDEALAGGLAATALHNHFFFDRPRVFFMHIAGEGGLDELATAVGRCLARVKAIRAARPAPSESFGDPPAPAPGDLKVSEIDAILKRSGELKGGLYKVVVGRQVAMHGLEVGAAMGINTWTAFRGSAADAVVDGDFAMREEELRPVLKALRRGNVRIVAIHNHMGGENPRLVFLHYWGRGPTADLARTLRSALDLAGS